MRTLDGLQISPTLFDMSPHPRYRHTDPQTSVDAARSVSPGAEARILEAFAMLDHNRRIGLTDDELAAALAPLYGPTVKTARSRLSKAGWLIDSGKRRTSVRGRAQIVWVLA